MREQTLRPEGQVAGRGALALGFALALGCTRTPPPPVAEAGAADDARSPDAAVDGGRLTDGGDGGALGAARDRGPFNVVLITVDSLRADMPWAGYERPIAPRLGALYKQSVAWTRAYSTSSFTSKSIPGFLTGRYPSELQRTGQFFTRYLEPKEFLCKNLAAEGISCVGAHGHMYFNPPNSGFEYGFARWKIVPGIQFDYTTDPFITSDKLTPMAIELTAEAAKDERPFVAWFHYMDVHDKYFSHEESPHFGTKSRDLYDEEVFYTDLWIGKLLDFIDAQPWGKRTAIIVSADHGEGFGEHNIWRHAHEIWEELVRVPLFARVPGREPRTIDVPRSGVDIAPTIAELVGMKEVPSMQGKSLLPEIDGAKPEERDVIVDLPEDDFNERRRAIVHGKYKLLAFGDDLRFSLFDLEADPGEKKDLWRDEPEVAKEMRERYREAGKRIVYVHPRGGIPGKEAKDPKKK